MAESLVHKWKKQLLDSGGDRNALQKLDQRLREFLAKGLNQKKRPHKGIKAVGGTTLLIQVELRSYSSSLNFKEDHLLCSPLCLTAMVSAFFSPITMTSFFPRVIPV